jgi:hypothetical protein
LGKLAIKNVIQASTEDEFHESPFPERDEGRAVRDRSVILNSEPHETENVISKKKIQDIKVSPG